MGFRASHFGPGSGCLEEPALVVFCIILRSAMEAMFLRCTCFLFLTTRTQDAWVVLQSSLSIKTEVLFFLWRCWCLRCCCCNCCGVSVWFRQCCYGYGALCGHTRLSYCNCRVIREEWRILGLGVQTRDAATSKQP